LISVFETCFLRRRENVIKSLLLPATDRACRQRKRAFYVMLQALCPGLTLYWVYELLKNVTEPCLWSFRFQTEWTMQTKGFKPGTFLVFRSKMTVCF